MAIECMLTTIDNPFDPFEDYRSWMLFDKEKGYDSAELLARIAKITDDMSDEEENAEIESAIDEIIKYDFMNVYTKATRTVKTDELNNT